MSLLISDDLWKIIVGIINNKFFKEKIDGLMEKYLRLENCKFLVVFKINRVVWNQFKVIIKKGNMGMQKCQKLFMVVVYVILEVFRGVCGIIKVKFVYFLVLILLGNRELNFVNC